MEHRDFGRTGLSVSCIGYGTNMLGRPPSAERPGDAERTTDGYYIGMVHAALEAGVNLFDTANSYQDGRSEELLGRALAGRRGEALIATKCGSRSRDFSADGIRRELEESLRRLRTDYVDILQLHSPSLQELEGTDWLEGMEALKAAGKLRVIGVSVHTAQDGVRLIEQTPVEALQVPFHILLPDARRELLPLAGQRGVGVLARVPMARGLLSGKYGSHSTFPDGDWHRHGFVGEPEEMLHRIDHLNSLAEEEGMTTAELALRWILCHPGVSAPIPGAKSLEHVRQNAGAGTAGPLPDGLYERVEAVAGRG
jgi:aryl-alcohol dehydrogenase-like predicted oxidoreductase